MRAPFSVLALNNAAAGSSTAFLLEGGAYVLDAVATFGGGSVTLQRLGPDGTTWITADAAAALTANGTSGAMALPPGSYRVTAATATANYARVTRVPGE